jgi:hypothetical protein
MSLPLSLPHSRSTQKHTLAAQPLPSLLTHASFLHTRPITHASNTILHLLRKTYLHQLLQKTHISFKNAYASRCSLPSESLLTRESASTTLLPRLDHSSTTSASSSLPSGSHCHPLIYTARIPITTCMFTHLCQPRMTPTDALKQQHKNHFYDVYYH